jgi:tripartite-type tricarboxylate transporter receptor subunit TctC
MGHIPYKGGAPALVDLMGGRLDAVFAPLVEVLPFIQGKKLKALAVTTPARSFVLPDVPTVAETFAGFDITLWNSIMTRTGTAPEIITKLNQAIQYVLAQPEVLKTLRSQGSNPSGNTPAEFNTLIAQEVPKWDAIIKLSGAETQ